MDSARDQEFAINLASSAQDHVSPFNVTPTIAIHGHHSLHFPPSGLDVDHRPSLNHSNCYVTLQDVRIRNPCGHKNGHNVFMIP